MATVSYDNAGIGGRGNNWGSDLMEGAIALRAIDGNDYRRGRGCGDEYGTMFVLNKLHDNARDIIKAEAELGRAIAHEGRHNDIQHAATVKQVFEAERSLDKRMDCMDKDLCHKFGEVHKHIDGVERYLERKLDGMESSRKDNVIEELRFEKLRRDCKDDTANTTQVIGSTITNTLVSLLSGNKAS